MARGSSSKTHPLFNATRKFVSAPLVTAHEVTFYIISVQELVAGDNRDTRGNTYLHNLRPWSSRLTSVSVFEISFAKHGVTCVHLRRVRMWGPYPESTSKIQSKTASKPCSPNRTPFPAFMSQKNSPRTALFENGYPEVVSPFLGEGRRPYGITGARSGDVFFPLCPGCLRPPSLAQVGIINTRISMTGANRDLFSCHVERGCYIEGAP